MPCKYWRMARLWRKTLMDAERIWQHLLDPNLILQAECKQLLPKYEELMSMLENIRNTCSPESKPSWDFVWLRMTWGLDVLKDFAILGHIGNNGKKASFERMVFILETQKQRLFPKDIIQNFRLQYEQNWFDHPKLAFEIVKAALHEAPIDIFSALRLNGSVCPRVADYFSFTKWLGDYPYEVYQQYKDLPEESKCLTYGENICR